MSNYAFGLEGLNKKLNHLSFLMDNVNNLIGLHKVNMRSAKNDLKQYSMIRFSMESIMTNLYNNPDKAQTSIDGMTDIVITSVNDIKSSITNVQREAVDYFAKELDHFNRLLQLLEEVKADTVNVDDLVSIVKGLDKKVCSALFSSEVENKQIALQYDNFKTDIKELFQKPDYNRIREYVRGIFNGEEVTLKGLKDFIEEAYFKDSSLKQNLFNEDDTSIVYGFKSNAFKDEFKVHFTTDNPSLVSVHHGITLSNNQDNDDNALVDVEKSDGNDEMKAFASAILTMNLAEVIENKRKELEELREEIMLYLDNIESVDKVNMTSNEINQSMSDIVKKARGLNTVFETAFLLLRRDYYIARAAVEMVLLHVYALMTKK